MFVKFKNKQKIRKTNLDITNLSSLQKEIYRLFGKIDYTTHQIVYQDVDGELVQIVDDSDLSNCLEERKETGEGGALTIIIQPISLNKPKNENNGHKNKPRNSKAAQRANHKSPLNEKKVGDVEDLYEINV